MSVLPLININVWSIACESVQCFQISSKICTYSVCVSKKKKKHGVLQMFNCFYWEKILIVLTGRVYLSKCKF